MEKRRQYKKLKERGAIVGLVRPLPPFLYSISCVQIGTDPVTPQGAFTHPHPTYCRVVSVTYIHLGTGVTVTL
jgi:hypothetical protein